VFNGLNNDSYLTTYPIKPECSSHWNWGENIVELPHCSAKTTTAGELLRIARERMGNDAVLEFSEGLGRDIVVALTCSACQERTPIYQPKHKVSVQQGICPSCGGERVAELAYQISGTDEYLDKTLADLQIPPLHIIPARSGTDYCFFELTGDEKGFFHYE